MFFISLGSAAGDGVRTQPERDQYCVRGLRWTCRGHHSHQQHQRYCIKPGGQPFESLFFMFIFVVQTFCSMIKIKRQTEYALPSADISVLTQITEAF